MILTYHISMSHQGLEERGLAKVHQCILLEVPLELLALVLNRAEHVLGIASHVTNVVRPKIVPVQQLVSESTVAGLLRGLDDRECIVGKEDLSKLLPHCRLVDKETWGKRPVSFGVRTGNDPSQKDGAPRNQLVIKREMRTPDDTSRGILCGQNHKARAIDLVQWIILVALESSKVLVDGFQILGPILWIHDWQGDGVCMGCLHLGLCR